MKVLVDVGGTNLRVYLWNSSNNIIMERWGYKSDSRDVTEQLFNILSSLIKERNIISILIGIPGDATSGSECIYCPPLNQYIVKEKLESIHKDVNVVNDMVVMACLLQIEGQDRSKDYVLIALGTSIGLCTIKKGDIFKNSLKNVSTYEFAHEEITSRKNEAFYGACLGREVEYDEKYYEIYSAGAFARYAKLKYRIDENTNMVRVEKEHLMNNKLGIIWKEYRKYLEEDVRNYLPKQWLKAEVIIRGGLMKALDAKQKSSVQGTKINELVKQDKKYSLNTFDTTGYLVVKGGEKVAVKMIKELLIIEGEESSEKNIEEFSRYISAISDSDYIKLANRERQEREIAKKRVVELKKELEGEIRKLTGEDLSILNEDIYFRIVAGGESNTLSKVHRDIYFHNILDEWKNYANEQTIKLWMPLYLESEYALGVIPGSHNETEYNDCRYEEENGIRKEFRCNVRADELTPLKVKPGEMLYFPSTLLHGSLPKNQIGKRRISVEITLRQVK